MAKTHSALELKLGPNKLLLRQSDRMHLNRHAWCSNRHNNADYELHIILKGCCLVDVEDHQHPMQEGQAILIAPGQYHRPQTLPGEFDYYSLSFSLSEGPLYESLHQYVPSCKIFSTTPEIAATCRNIYFEMAAGNPFRQELLQALRTQLFLYTLRQLNLAEKPPAISQTPSEKERTEMIDNFFEHHMADRAGSEKLADQLHLSRRQLARVLQEYYGMGFQQKLIHTRMDHAAWLLRSTDKKVSEVAGAVGYTSEAAFYQVFRHHFSMTPQQYRILLQKQTDEKDHCI